MQRYPITSLREELSFTNDLMLDENFVLLPAGCPAPKESGTALKEWEIDEFLCNGTVDFKNNLFLQNLRLTSLTKKAKAGKIRQRLDSL